MTIAWERAAMDGFGVLMGIAGGSRSGKTFSGLEMATGIAGPRGRIAAIDTESKRMSHYSNQFTFFRSDMKPPFRPMRFAEYALDAEEQGFSVLLIDSFSSEWSGDGGVLDWHEQELQRMVPDGNEDRRQKASRSAWLKPKAEHKMMMASLLQRRIPILLLMRAEDKLDKNFKPLGWVPTQDKRLLFELTAFLTLHPDTPGEPRYDLPHKVEGQHRHLFPERRKLSATAGAGLWAWACGDQAPAATAPAAPPAAPEPPPEQDDGFPGDKPIRQVQANARDRAVLFVAEMRDALAGCADRAAINALLNKKKVQEMRDRLTEAYPDLARELLDAITERTTDIAAAEVPADSNEEEAA